MNLEPQTNATAAPTDNGAVAEDLLAEDVLAQDLLVEDVSIDGMCGVY